MQLLCILAVIRIAHVYIAFITYKLTHSLCYLKSFLCVTYSRIISQLMSRLSKVDPSCRASSLLVGYVWLFFVCLVVVFVCVFWGFLVGVFYLNANILDTKITIIINVLVISIKKTLVALFFYILCLMELRVHIHL